MAIDCCGREVIVPRDVVTRPDPVGRAAEATQTANPDRDFVLVLCLSYQETLDAQGAGALQLARVLDAGAGARPRARGLWTLLALGPPRGSRQVRLAIRAALSHRRKPPEEKPPDEYAADTRPRRSRRIRARAVRRRRPLLPDAGVPARSLHRAGAHRGDRARAFDTQEDIVTTGRRRSRRRASISPHICWTSWRHGGVVRVSDLDALRVRFERPLLDEPQPKQLQRPARDQRTHVLRGVRRRTRGHGLRALQARPLPRRAIGARRSTRFSAIGVCAAHRTHGPRDDRCDFLLDCHGNPVDGEHLGGRYRRATACRRHVRELVHGGLG